MVSFNFTNLHNNKKYLYNILILEINLYNNRKYLYNIFNSDIVYNFTYLIFNSILDFYKFTYKMFKNTYLI